MLQVWQILMQRSQRLQLKYLYVSNCFQNLLKVLHLCESNCFQNLLKVLHLCESNWSQNLQKVLPSNYPHSQFLQRSQNQTQWHQISLKTLLKHLLSLKASRILQQIFTERHQCVCLVTQMKLVSHSNSNSLNSLAQAISWHTLIASLIVLAKHICSTWTTEAKCLPKSSSQD